LPTSTFSSFAVIDERFVCFIFVFEFDLEKFALVLDLSMVLISTIKFGKCKKLLTTKPNLLNFD